jgi:hypothetical protein
MAFANSRLCQALFDNCSRKNILVIMQILLIELNHIGYSLGNIENRDGKIFADIIQEELVCEVILIVIVCNI